MPFEINCPSCNTRLAVKEANIGQSVRCPKCQHTMVIPDNRPPALPVAPPPLDLAPPRPRRDDDYDDDDRPRRPRRDDDYDDDDRPRRPRRDDYDDDRPRRVRRRPDEGAGAAVASMVLGIIGLVTQCIPYVNFLGLVCSILAIILGAVGRNSRSSGMAVAGLVLGILVIVIWVVIIILIVSIGYHVNEMYNWR